MKEVNNDKFDDFGTDMIDGRLTEESDKKIYRLHEAIRLTEELGRPLTAEELKNFEVYDVVAEDNNYVISK
ncbi:MAG: hypothetical protein J6L69_01220 [Lachnospiraceae bacterium]|nr:hypothetical protein [Lachnospiraceae bacterium]